MSKAKEANGSAIKRRTASAKKGKHEESSKVTKRSAATKRKVASGRAVKKVKSSQEEEEIPGDARKYFKEGQKYITPPNGDGTRAFYESLREENPYSLIAIKYCVEFGVLSGTKHRETFRLYKLLQEGGAFKGMLGGINKKFQKEEIERLLKLAESRKK